MRGTGLVLIIMLAACSGGAVVFAPTEAPPDLSPAVYTHPGGAFSLLVPRSWAVYVQNRTNLASAAFSLPGDPEPVLVVAALRPEPALSEDTLAAVIDRYQTQVRPDVERYTPGSREAMGDGSWRMTGIRLSPAGLPEPVNTFVDRAGPILGILDARVPSDPAARAEVERVVNSVRLNADASLVPAPLSALNGVSATPLRLLHLATWQTASGVFFITGEVANGGDAVLSAPPVQAALLGADGLTVAEAADTVMGYALAPGGFAPFSLRFGQGQPALAVAYRLTLGNAAWTPEPALALAPADALTWTDESSRDADGRLFLSGTVTNASDRTVHRPRVVATVFDSRQNVVAAAFAPADVDTLAPGASAAFRLLVPEMGGEPANYLVTAQALLDAAGDDAARGGSG